MIQEPNLSIYFVIAIMSLIANVVVHQLGSAVGAIVVGWIVSEIGIGPLRIRCRGRSLRFEVNRNGISWFGYVSALPRSLRGMRLRYVIILTIGTIANVAVAGIAIVAAAQLNDSLPPRDPAGEGVGCNFLLCPRSEVVAALIIAAFVSALLSLFSLVANLDRFGIVIDEAKWREFRAILVASGQTSMGRRPRDWPAEVFDPAPEAGDGSANDFSCRLFAMYYHLDSRHIGRTGEILDALIADLKGATSFLIKVEAAYFVARYRRDAVAARALLPADDSQFPGYRLRAEAAVLLAEGRPNEAAGAVREALEALDRAVHPDGSACEREMLADILGECNETRTPRESFQGD